MHLVELNTFLAIVETGSLVGASEKLNVTQSTVTARLKSLEAELGQQLIVRNRSGAALTSAGEKLRRYASTISDLWRQARQETGLPDALSSVCNIGYEPELWDGLTKRFFETIRNDLPQVALSAWQGSGPELARWLRSGLIDVAITYDGDIGQMQISYPLGVDQLVLVSSRADAPVRFNPGYVYVEAGEDFGRDHAIAYADASTARVSFGSAPAALSHILEFGGSAYLPLRLVEEHINAKRLFVLADAPTFEREIYLIGNRAAVSNWPWFPAVLETLVRAP
ncbi:MAG: LysR family transcriptional regulator [Pseudomonadota bacterium]